MKTPSPSLFCRAKRSGWYASYSVDSLCLFLWVSSWVFSRADPSHHLCLMVASDLFPRFLILSGHIPPIVKVRFEARQKVGRRLELQLVDLAFRIHLRCEDRVDIRGEAHYGLRL